VNTPSALAAVGKVNTARTMVPWVMAAVCYLYVRNLALGKLSTDSASAKIVVVMTWPWLPLVLCEPHVLVE